MIESTDITAVGEEPLTLDIDRIGAVYRCLGPVLPFDPAAVEDMQINGLPVVEMTIRRTIPYGSPVAVKYEFRVGFNRKPTPEQVSERQRVEPLKNWSIQDYSGLPD